MEVMDLKIFDELLATIPHYNIDMPVIPIDDLLEELEIEIK